MLCFSIGPLAGEVREPLLSSAKITHIKER